MKTILVVYTNRLLSKKEIAQQKRYSFNTEDNLKEGDIIQTKEYTTNLQVVKVLDEVYKYYNRSTGELSNTFNSSSQWEIRTIKIREDQEDTVYGTLVTTCEGIKC